MNTDLDLVASCDLAPLAAALKSQGVFALHVTQHKKGRCYGTFEVDGTSYDYRYLSDPDKTISAMLDAIESLGKKDRAVWKVCSLREFNIGYECGDEPWAFNDVLTNETLLRMAKLGASLRITLYPPRTLPKRNVGRRENATNKKQKGRAMIQRRTASS